ncbi:hypothetical protein ACFL1M_01255 [Patescibacteria group bacterium]
MVEASDTEKIHDQDPLVLINQIFLEKGHAEGRSVEVTGVVASGFLSEAPPQLITVKKSIEKLIDTQKQSKLSIEISSLDGRSSQSVLVNPESDEKYLKVSSMVSMPSGVDSIEASEHKNRQQGQDLLNSILKKCRWGYGKDELDPHGFLQLREIRWQDLGLIEAPGVVQESVEKSKWFEAPSLGIVIEVRSDILKEKPLKEKPLVEISDFDDTLFSATKWHQNEFSLFQKSENLQRRGVHISPQKAKEIYELSKIFVPGIAKNEKRYTPLVNVLLLTQLSKDIEAGVSAHQQQENILAFQQHISRLVQTKGEEVLADFDRDKDIEAVFMSPQNSPKNFVIKETTEDILETPTDPNHDAKDFQSKENSLKVVATRGKIGGPLGQIHKMHATEIAQKVDVVIYTNDLKAGTLDTLTWLIPWVKRAQTRIYDDNSSEIRQWWEVAHEKGLLSRIELVQVRNIDAKRRHDAPVIKESARVGDLENTTQTIDQTENPEVVYDHYIGSEFHPSQIM